MIEFRSVTKQYPDGTRAVDDFSLVIPSRKTTVFVGSSGCGKTTILRMINRMVDKTSGDIEIDGRRLGLILDVGGYYKNVITLAPSLEISYPEIDLAMALLDRLLHRVTKK